MVFLKVENVWKKFRIPHEKKTTILEHLGGVLQIFSRKRLSYEEFWALKSINFTITEGESLGIIGENGSGKSTLLKIISNILRPERGTIELDGKVAPILELGVGFHPDLTVKENILIYGSVMGLRNKEIKNRINSVLEFSGLDRFKDAKLKNLSSGMHMRLAFSIAVETDPDIFLIDEALAVGDMEFQKKCISKFKTFKEERKTIVFVSHSLDLVKKFCEKTLYLSKGEVISFNKTDNVLNEYMKRTL